MIMKGLKVVLAGLSVGAFMSFSMASPQQDIPTAVLDALKAKYPEAKNVEWEVKNGVYEADFDLAKVEYEVCVSKEGKILKVEQDITSDDVPAAVLAKMQADAKDGKLEDIEKVEIGKTVYYKADVDSKAGDFKVVYSASGAKQDVAILDKLK